MNLSTVALLFLAWQMLSNTQNTPKQTPKPDLTGFLSDDTKNILDSLGKISSKESSGDDKLGAIIQMISNPTVMNLAQNLFSGNKNNAQKQEKERDTFSNEEGYSFEKPSASSQEFFRPIDNIADAEVKSKLYWFYDNWYVQ